MPSGVKMSHEEFVNKLKQIQPNLEVLSTYVNMKGPKINVRDNIGIEYLVGPQDLLEGKVPTLIVAVDVNKAFELKARVVHGDVYDYSKVDYKKAKVNITISCKIHGDWNLTPDWHLRGRGCPKCSRKIVDERLRLSPMGWSKNAWIKSGKLSTEFDGFKLYILKCWNEEESFYKIGRTYHTVKSRFDRKKLLPYNWQVILEKVGSAEDVFDAEGLIKSMLDSYRYIPKIEFPGQFECFKEAPITEELVNNLIPSVDLTVTLKEMFSEDHLTFLQKYLLTKLRQFTGKVKVRQLQNAVKDDLDADTRPSNSSITRALNKLIKLGLIEKVMIGTYKAL